MLDRGGAWRDMRLGIDFGTTRLVVAAVDRGNYPILSFETVEGAADWFPSMVALRGPERRFGWSAWASQAEVGWTFVRSLKRTLQDAAPQSWLPIDGERHGLMQLLVGMTEELKRALGLEGPVEVMLGVPANANSNQRFLTVEAFRRAGFQVLGLLNEPSAAAIEFGHRQKLVGRLLVYDLGGGTFDASLVELDEKVHTVVATDGIATLGGDDFDHVLAEMVGQRIHATFHYVPLHSSPAGQRFAARPTECPVTDDISARLLRLPFYTDLTEADAERVLAAFTAAVESAPR